MIDDGVALRIFDSLVADGVSRLDAVALGRAARRELQKDNRLTQLFVVQVLDTWGQPHAVIARKPRSGSVTLFRFDVLAMRRAERQATARALAEQPALPA